ncbi:MAG: XdhC family protein [Geoalkalibacter sp.]|uniref:XdhC family protein n=1 Tax=Geoalkalibacter sp. TaxID=3041440 RepID=UPI003D0A7160
MEDIALYEEIIRLKNGEQPAALVTLIRSTGSTPRKAGAKMLVRSDGSIQGTIGGGRLEVEVIQKALETVENGRPSTAEFDLTEDFGHACGGRLMFYFEPINPRPCLVIFGAGHIGRMLAQLAHQSGFYVTVVEENPQRPPLECADETIFCTFEEAFARLKCGKRSAIAVVTSEHERDFSVVRAALDTEAGFIGMLGSQRKKAALIDYLRRSGLSEDQLGRVTSPIGLDIGAQTPAEIAVSVVAQLISFRRQHADANRGDRAGSRPLDEDGPLQTASAPQ